MYPQINKITAHNTMVETAERITKRASEAYAFQLDTYVNSILRPKPKLLPFFIWKIIVKRVVTISFYNLNK